MIPLAEPNLCGNELKYLTECVHSNYVSSVGRFVDQFEAMVAAYSGAQFAVATSAGTTGLHVALTALGVGPGDLVILPSFTFIASANAIAHCGALPWLFDVDPRTWTLDCDLVESALCDQTISQAGKVIHQRSGLRVAAIMPVYTLGLPANMDKLVALAQRYHLPIVADAAAALGAEVGNRKIAQLGADATVFSFNGNKTITAGGGGAVVSNNKDLIQLIRHLTTTARVGRDYDHDRVGFNYRMTNLQAAVGCAQMENADVFVQAKRRIAMTYRQALAGVTGVEPFPEPEPLKSACWFSGFRLHMEHGNAGSLIDYLAAASIGARRFWKPIHLQTPYRHCPQTAMLVSEKLWPEIVTLPSSTHLTVQDQDVVIKTTLAGLKLQQAAL